MDFALFFDKIDLELDSIEQYPTDTLYHSLFLYQDDFPNLEKTDIALFSIDDNRATSNHVLDATELRKSLYSLKKSDSFINVVDLGVLRPGEEYGDTMDRLSEVLDYLFSENITPVIINSSQDVLAEMYKSASRTSHSDRLNISLIDSSLDLEDDGVKNRSFMNEVLSHLPNKLHRLKLLGYQSYLVNQNINAVFQKLCFEELRLGDIKKDVFSTEVYLRNSHLVSFDLGSLKSTEFPANNKNSPFGITAEEACQLSWFAGHSDDLIGISFANYFEENDVNGLSSNGLGVMIWYFIQGYYSRIKEDLEKESVSYIVENDNFAENLTFIKGSKSNKWWLTVDGENIPCSYSDYLKANEGVLPEIWMREVSR